MGGHGLESGQAEVAWLGKGRGRNCGSLDVGPCTREEVEQQRRAGVTRSHTALSICYRASELPRPACVWHVCVCACEWRRVNCTHEWTLSLSTLSLLSLCPTRPSAVSFYYACVHHAHVRCPIIMLFLLSITGAPANHVVDTRQSCPWPHPPNNANYFYCHSYCLVSVCALFRGCRSTHTLLAPGAVLVRLDGLMQWRWQGGVRVSGDPMNNCAQLCPRRTRCFWNQRDVATAQPGMERHMLE